jgi:carbonic anhydrase
MNKNNQSLKAIGVALLAAFSFSSHAADHKKAEVHGGAHAAHAAHWGYEGMQGAQHWGAMEPGFALCKSGKEQSPIDITMDGAGKPSPIEFGYAQGAADVINNGHTIQINLAAGGSIKLDGVDYALVQFHFHTPSEEKIRGKAYPMVAHLVHKSATGQLAVVAVLFEEGDENKALKAVFSGLPAKAGDSVTLASGFNTMDVLPAYKGYYKFVGSLTTPPCSEGVRWQVLKQRVELSKAQIAAFRKLYKMNARPVQPLHGRKVDES